MRSADRPMRGTGRAIGADLTAARPKTKFKDVWPEIKALILPRRLLLLGAFLLMVLNRSAGLVLPASFKPLIDLVFTKHQLHLLPWVVGAVLLATTIQGITSYALTQLLSKEGQRLIADLRRQVQAHIGRLPVGYYDENRTGTLVARIMTDVEGVRNIIGTGVVDFVGGVLTAVFAFIYLMKQSVSMTLVTFVIMIAFASVVQRAFKTIRPIFRERAKINAEVTGRLTESLGGVRVVKGYHAEASEAKVFAGGVERLLNNVISSLTAQSLMTLSSTVILGVVGAVVMYMGAHLNAANKLTTGGYFSYVMFLAFMTAPIVQLVAIGTQLTEAMAGLDRTREIFAEQQEDADPARSLDSAHPRRCPLRRRRLLVRPGQARPARHQLRVHSGHGHGARRLQRLRQVHHHLAHLRLPHRAERRRAHRRPRSRRGQAEQLSPAARRRAAGDLSLRRHHSRECEVLAPDRHGGGVPQGLLHRPRRRVRRRASLSSTTPSSANAASSSPAASASALHCARHPRRPAHPDPRRSHQLARLRI
jgi:ABC-type multidrug transport system fused ATPase/permease subunit